MASVPQSILRSQESRPIPERIETQTTKVEDISEPTTTQEFIEAQRKEFSKAESETTKQIKASTPKVSQLRSGSLGVKQLKTLQRQEEKAERVRQDIRSKSEEFETDVSKKVPEYARPEYFKKSLNEVSSKIQSKVDLLQKKIDRKNKRIEDKRKDIQRFEDRDDRDDARDDIEEYEDEIDEINAELNVYKGAVNQLKGSKGSQLDALKKYYSGYIKDKSRYERDREESRNRQQEQFREFKQSKQGKETIENLGLSGFVSRSKFNKAVKDYNKEVETNRKELIKTLDLPPDSKPAVIEKALQEAKKGYELQIKDIEKTAKAADPKAKIIYRDGTPIAIDSPTLQQTIPIENLSYLTSKNIQGFLKRIDDPQIFKTSLKGYDPSTIFVPGKLDQAIKETPEFMKPIIQQTGFFKGAEIEMRQERAGELSKKYNISKNEAGYLANFEQKTGELPNPNDKKFVQDVIRFEKQEFDRGNLFKGFLKVREIEKSFKGGVQDFLLGSISGKEDFKESAKDKLIYSKELMSEGRKDLQKFSDAFGTGVSAGIGIGGTIGSLGSLTGLAVGAGAIVKGGTSAISQKLEEPPIYGFDEETRKRIRDKLELDKKLLIETGLGATQGALLSIPQPGIFGEGVSGFTKKAIQRPIRTGVGTLFALDKPVFALGEQVGFDKFSEYIQKQNIEEQRLRERELKKMKEQGFFGDVISGTKIAGKTVEGFVKKIAIPESEFESTLDLAFEGLIGTDVAKPIISKGQKLLGAGIGAGLGYQTISAAEQPSDILVGGTTALLGSGGLAELKTSSGKIETEFEFKGGREEQIDLTGIDIDGVKAYQDNLIKKIKESGELKGKIPVEKGKPLEFEGKQETFGAESKGKEFKLSLIEGQAKQKKRLAQLIRSFEIQTPKETFGVILKAEPENSIKSKKLKKDTPLLLKEQLFISKQGKQPEYFEVGKDILSQSEIDVEKTLGSEDRITFEEFGKLEPDLKEAKKFNELMKERDKIVKNRLKIQTEKSKAGISTLVSPLKRFIFDTKVQVNDRPIQFKKSLIDYAKVNRKIFKPDEVKLKKGKIKKTPLSKTFGKVETKKVSQRKPQKMSKVTENIAKDNKQIFAQTKQVSEFYGKGLYERTGFEMGRMPDSPGLVFSELNLKAVEMGRMPDSPGLVFSELNTKAKELGTEVKSKMDSKLKIKPEADLKLKSRLDTRTKLDLRTDLKTEPKLKLDTRTKLDLRTDLKTEPKLKLYTRTKLDLRTDLKTDLEIKPEVDIKPEIEIKLRDGKDKPIRSKQLKRISLKPKEEEFFYPEAKRNDQWVRLSETGLTKNAALSRAARVVDNTVSAKFRIKKALEGDPKIKDSYFNYNKNKFRDFIIRKGKKIPVQNTFVEKQGKGRIDTSGEKVGLTIAKYLKQQGWAGRKKSKNQRALAKKLKVPKNVL